ncbi:MAG: NAD(+)/NADH kinase [archaeon]|nr:NAD(+)/NADH kinase [archaeon]
MLPKKIGITGRKENISAKKSAKETIRILEEKGILVETDKAFLGKGKSISAFSGDLVLSFGGDGTLLSVFRELKKKIPVIGMGFGNVGYLQAFNEFDAETSIEKILSGKIKIETRTRIQAKVDGKKIGQALNEVLIVPQKAGRIMCYKMKIGSEIRAEAGDGLIVATPTGSTAHALSAGGPIVKGNASVFVLVSVNPVDWTHRPLIINDHEKIVVTDFGKMKAELIVDGQKSYSIKKKVEISKGTEVLMTTK